MRAHQTRTYATGGRELSFGLLSLLHNAQTSYTTDKHIIRSP